MTHDSYLIDPTVVIKVAEIKKILQSAFDFFSTTFPALHDCIFWIYLIVHRVPSSYLALQNVSHFVLVD